MAFFLEHFFFPLVLSFFALAVGFLINRIDWIRQTARENLSAMRRETSREAAEKFSAYQAETDRKFQKELEHIKTDLGLQSAIAPERQRIALNDGAARDKFLQIELNRSADPILQATTDLRLRIENILRKQGCAWFGKPKQTDSGFQQTAAYFRSSTLYVFCRYFCYVELLNERLGYLFEERGDQREEFTDLLRVASGVLGNHDDTIVGAHIFHWQQRALGEVMTVTLDGRERCMRYAAFLDQMRSEGFSSQIGPLEAILEDLKKDGPTWKRLEEFEAILIQIEQKCRAMLNLPPANQLEERVQQTALPKRKVGLDLDQQF